MLPGSGCGFRVIQSRKQLEEIRLSLIKRPQLNLNVRGQSFASTTIVSTIVNFPAERAVLRAG